MMKNRYLLILSLLFFSFHIYAQTEEKTDYEYVLVEAVKQKNLGNIPEAINLYKLLLKSNPDCSAANYDLGNLYISVKQYESAEDLLSKAYQADSKNIYYISAYVDVLSVNSNFKKALKVLKLAKKLYPDNVELRYAEATVCALAGKSKKAITVLNDIEKEYGYSDKVSLLLADIYSKNSNYKAALGELDKLIKLYPEVDQFVVMAAELCDKAGMKEDAMAYYHRAFDLDSSNIYAVTNLADYYREQNKLDQSLYFLKYSFYNESIDLKRKLAILSYYLMSDSLVTRYKNGIDGLFTALNMTYKHSKDVQLMEVDYRVELGDYKGAFKILKPVLFSEVDNYSVWIQGIQLSFNSDDNEEIVETCERAYEKFPDSTLVKYFYAVSLFQTEDYKGSLSVFDRIDESKLGQDGLYMQILSLKAEAFNNLGLYDRSDSVFYSLLSLFPDNIIACNNFAYYLAKRGIKLDEALRYSEKAIGAEPLNATFIDTYAWILYNLGRFKEAESYIREALELGGDRDSDVLEHAGFIYKSLGDKKRALDYFKKSLEKGGDALLIVPEIEALILILDEG